jgi:hypothetical protein
MEEDKRRLAYFAFAVEAYKKKKNMSGKDAFNYLHSIEADSYIYDMFDLLHVHGTEYLMDELETYASARNAG